MARVPVGRGRRHARRRLHRAQRQPASGSARRPVCPHRAHRPREGHAVRHRHLGTGIAGGARRGRVPDQAEQARTRRARRRRDRRRGKHAGCRARARAHRRVRGRRADTRRRGSPSGHRRWSAAAAHPRGRRAEHGGRGRFVPRRIGAQARPGARTVVGILLGGRRRQCHRDAAVHRAVPGGGCHAGWSVSWRPSSKADRASGRSARSASWAVAGSASPRAPRCGGRRHPLASSNRAPTRRSRRSG